MARDLTALQRKVLETLAELEPRWTLAGGAALVGFHLRHRTTRDLDLFWRGRDRLDPDMRREVEGRLRRAGLEAVVVQVSPSHLRLRVDDGRERVLLDLIAEPSPALEPPGEVPLGARSIRVDGLHEILVDKVCALLGRSEIRDLADVRGILDAGGDLERALADAPRRDSGFSALTLAWVLRGMPLAEVAAAAGSDEEETRALASFRDALVARLIETTDPEAPAAS